MLGVKIIRSIVLLMPLWLFLCGFLSGAQFSLNNYPLILIGGFAFFYYGLLFAKDSLKQSVIYSFMFGYGFFSYSHSWISHPLTAFGDLYASLQPIVFVVVPALLGLYFVLVGVCNYYLKREGGYRVIALSVVTVFGEYFRCEYTPAVPLGQVGSMWLTVPYIAQGAALFGVYGLSFLTILFSYSFGNIGQSKLPIGVSSCVCFALFVFGAWRVSTTSLVLSNHVIRVVPTSFEQVDKFKSMELRIEHLKQLVEASSVVSSAGPAIILWPETTIEFALLQHGMGYDFTYPEIKSYLHHMLPKESMLLAGIVLRTAKNEAYNVLFGLTKERDIVYIYKKRFLAPFGEFMPSFLREMAKVLGIHAMDDFNRGSEHQEQLVLDNGLKIKPIICYEGSFAGQTILPNQPTDLMTVSTNDAWFRYNGKEQQFVSHAFRAIEEGVPIIRAANGGFSGYVSPLGTYSVSLSNKPMDLTFHKPLSETLYRWLINRCAYWLEILFVICVCWIGLVEFFYRRRIRI
ncbi:MAG: apolipoprotein N-acyltransferase [Alphaproteobacteria bacterium]|nr:apolipoprotein N-acyltransferase [Alphaproteobacteria bacterium]